MHLWVIYLFKNPVFVCEDVLECCPKVLQESDDWMTDSSVFAEGKVLADLVGLGSLANLGFSETLVFPNQIV